MWIGRKEEFVRSLCVWEKWLKSGGRFWGRRSLWWLQGKRFGWRNGTRRSRGWRVLEGGKGVLMKFSCARGFAHPRGCSRRLAPSPKTPFPIPASRFVVFPILMHVLMPVPALFVSTNIKCQIGMTFALGDARVNASNSLPSPPSRCSFVFTRWNVCVSVCILNIEFWYCRIMLYLSHHLYFGVQNCWKKKSI